MDNDGVPELFLWNHYNGVGTAKIYTYTSGNVKFLKSYGELFGVWTGRHYVAREISSEGGYDIAHYYSLVKSGNAIKEKYHVVRGMNETTRMFWIALYDDGRKIAEDQFSFMFEDTPDAAKTIQNYLSGSGYAFFRFELWGDDQNGFEKIYGAELFERDPLTATLAYIENYK